MPFSSENPFSPETTRKPDPVAFVRESLGVVDAEEMKALLEHEKFIAPPEEDFSTPDDLALSPAEKEKVEGDEMIKALIAHEKQALSTFFGKDIHVPPPPAEITIERLKQWEAMGMELHYLPDEDLTEITRNTMGQITKVQAKHLISWKNKPEQWFFSEIQFDRLSAHAVKLPGCWVLVDTRQKPSYKKGEQMYENDPFAPVLEALRASGFIEDYIIKGSRFNISFEELEKPEVVAAFAKALGVSPSMVSVQRALEFNVLGNIYHPEWGKTDTNEWFSDRYRGGELACGGYSRDGGLSSVGGGCKADYRRNRVGFRLIVRFPSK